MKTVVILSDTLNRRHLSIYGDSWVQTPNLTRLAERSTVFHNHWVGSAPCMPARRDLFTGRLGFLERNWGGIEPFDQTLPELLRQHGVYTCMETDHYHYLEVGGEGYLQAFDAWECHRGQEKDVLPGRISAIRGRDMPEDKQEPSCDLKEADYPKGKYNQYNQNKAKFREESDYPTPMTLRRAASWLEENKEEDDFLLFVECFDPHEPFDAPPRYLAQYGAVTEDGNWPDYGKRRESPETADRTRRQYAATLTMFDHWLGKLLDVMDREQMWEDTAVVLTTDHGFMLGEHDYYGKNMMPAFNEVMHIPMMIHLPGQKGREDSRALTQNIDLFPTLLELHGVDPAACRNPIHGRSLLPVLNGDEDSVRDYALYGYYGKSVNITDGSHTYFRAARQENNMPLYLYTALPTSLLQYLGGDSIPDYTKIEMGRYLSWTDYPVYRIPGDAFRSRIPSQAFDHRSEHNAVSALYHIAEDYGQRHNLLDDAAEAAWNRILYEQLVAHDCPAEQLERLGITGERRARREEEHIAHHV